MTEDGSELFSALDILQVAVGPNDITIRKARFNSALRENTSYSNIIVTVHEDALY